MFTSHISKNAFHGDYTQLANLKDYTGNSLTYIDRILFSYFQDMASLFLVNLASLIDSNQKTKKCLTSLFETVKMAEICCIARKTLIDRFAMFCIRLTNEKRIRPIKDYSSPSMFSMV